MTQRPFNPRRVIAPSPFEDGEYVDVSQYNAVGDGVTDDSAAIADALAAVSSTGGSLVFPPGVYAVGSDGWEGFSVSNKDNVTVLGAGARIKLLANVSTNKAIFTFSDCDDLWIDGLKIDGNDYSALGIELDTCVRYRITNNRIYDLGDGTNAVDGGVINTRTCSKGLITGNHIGPCNTSTDGQAYRGIWMGSTGGTMESETRVSNNHVEGMEGSGIVNMGVDIAVDGNVIDSCFSGIIISTATDAQSKNITISGNVAMSGTAHGFQTDVSNSIPVVDVVITGNVFRDNANSGMFCNALESSIISDNICDLNNTSEGASNAEIRLIGDCEGVICSNNVTTSSGFGHGIALQASDSVHEGHIISGNRISGANRGINMEANNAVNIWRDLQISDNIIEDCVYGVYARQSNATADYDQVTFSNNKVHNSSSNDWFLRCIDSANRVTGLHFIGNTGTAYWYGNGPEDDGLLPHTSIGNQWDSSFKNLTSTASTFDEEWFFTYTNTGASGTVEIDAPEAFAGNRFRMVRTASQAFRFDPDGTEIVGAGGAGKYLELGSDNAYVELTCFVDGAWVITAESGTITYEP